MTRPCPWCEEPVEPIKRGGYVKKFCSAHCRLSYKNGLARLMGWIAEVIGRPGALKEALAILFPSGTVATTRDFESEGVRGPDEPLEGADG